MSNEEVNKILSMLDRNELEDLRHFLLKEQNIINNSDRQNVFENYLINKSNYVRICVDSGVQKFTNGSSIFIIRSNLLNLETVKLNKNKDKYKFTSSEQFDSYLIQLSYITNFDVDFVGLEDLYTKTDNKYVFIRSSHSKNTTKIYDVEEIKNASIILNEPKYSISKCASILKAESDIGKAYILSLKK